MTAAVAAAPLRIELPAGSLARSIEQLAAQTGVSIGLAGPLPPIEVSAVHGVRSVDAALDRLLRGTGYRAVKVSSGVYRIERAPQARATRAAKPSPINLEASEPEIIITARKRNEALSRVPATVRVVPGSRLQSAIGVPGTSDLADDDAALTVAQLGSGASRTFLRGIGDAPLNGFNQGTVAVLLDDARMTYDAPDPDLALVDIDRVEILEGPQGPLYGTGALGGIVRIEPNRPDLAQASGVASTGIAVTSDRGLSDFQSGYLNLPLTRDRLGMRIAAYRARNAGWIDNVGGRRNSNRESLAGGRVALRWRPAGQWTVDLTSVVQSRAARDSQYVDGGLGALNRPARVLEPRDADAMVGAMSISGPVGAVSLTSVTAITRQELVTTFDATPLAPLLGTTGATRVRDARKYVVLDQELRLSSGTRGSISWLGGISVLRASTNGHITATDAQTSLPLLRFDRSVLEAAAYGDLSAALSHTLSVSAGARLSYNDVEEEGVTKAGLGKKGDAVARLSASADLNWVPHAGRQFFLRVATADRPGGLNVVRGTTPPTYSADHLASVEAGSRLRPGSNLAVDVTIFASRWRHVQADQLLANGLVATENVGNGENLGVDGQVRWTIEPGTRLDASFMAQTARLDSTAGSAVTIDDRRLPAVPHLAVRAHVSREFRIGSWAAEIQAGAHYTDATHLSFDPVLDRRTGGYLTFDAGLNVSRGAWSLGISGENLGKSTEDSFAFGNPYRIAFAPQRTPLRPATVSFRVSRHF